MTPLYSIGTWDTSKQCFSPHPGLPAYNLTREKLVAVIRRLRKINYSCHRIRERVNLVHTGDVDSDPSVIIQRTDGISKRKILKQWKCGL